MQCCFSHFHFIKIHSDSHEISYNSNEMSMMQRKRKRKPPSGGGPSSIQTDIEYTTKLIWEGMKYITCISPRNILPIILDYFFHSHDHNWRLLFEIARPPGRRKRLPGKDSYINIELSPTKREIRTRNSHLAVIQRIVDSSFISHLVKNDPWDHINDWILGHIVDESSASFIRSFLTVGKTFYISTRSPYGINEGWEDCGQLVVQNDQQFAHRDEKIYFRHRGCIMQMDWISSRTFILSCYL
jgi:hypothetical protein